KIPAISPAARRQIEERYFKQESPKALAIAAPGWFGGARGTRRESARLAVERCGYIHHRPCLIVAVDGFLTVQIPKSRKIDRIFLPSTEPEIPDADKERVARIYQGHEWRALARGKNGSWHAFADAP